VRFGGTSGRHGLLLGASGSGKSNALLWCVARHIDAGFGAVVIDMKGDQLLERQIEAEQLIAALRPTDRALWATATYAGLRSGELQALPDGLGSTSSAT
jgi:ABC-type phosphonate transport system ATPase subunit